MGFLEYTLLILSGSTLIQFSVIYFYFFHIYSIVVLQYIVWLSTTNLEIMRFIYSFIHNVINYSRMFLDNQSTISFHLLVLSIWNNEYCTLLIHIMYLLDHLQKYWTEKINFQFVHRLIPKPYFSIKFPQSIWRKRKSNSRHALVYILRKKKCSIPYKFVF